MKIAESWLREWVNPDFDTEALAHRLTMAGHEVDDIAIEGTKLDGVVVAEVLSVAKHPNADRLRVCAVSDGGTNPIQIVCGAPNVTRGMKSALATPGVTLPNGITLRQSEIRGVTSQGMLCSAAELGLGDESDGIIALPTGAPVGTPLADYLQLPDAVIDLNLTANRGDCFSILGIARDVSALSGASLRARDIEPIVPTIADRQPVVIADPQLCPVFAGRVVRNVDPEAKTPVWMVERLRRAGHRSINPIVDATNYVMLELGQPLHAYDLALLSGPIRPRLAAMAEQVTLLDGKELVLNDDTLVISDDSGAIGLAGIMGGMSTAVSNGTIDVFFEAAFWPPEAIAGRARVYGLHTDASVRFERGVDPDGQARAVERATELLLEIAGGNPGPLDITSSPDDIPQRKVIHLRRARLSLLLGLDIDDATVIDILRKLGFATEPADDGWNVTAPSYRFDVELEVDLIEEIARIYGYDEIPETTAIAATPLAGLTESRIELERAAANLVARDYHEVVTYSFIDAASNIAITGQDAELVLNNPISSEMSTMRASLWPGMLMAVAANAARQQDRIRFFEIGKSFHGTPDNHKEVLRIAAVVAGSRFDEQWNAKAQAVDFFDIKSDVMALLELSDLRREIEFIAAVEHPALQPGQSANVIADGQFVGVVGKLHPRHWKLFDLKRDVFVFELDVNVAFESTTPVAVSVSKYPSIRRDIAVVVDEQISAGELVRAVASAAPEIISSVRIFDVYKGPGIEAGLKSVALGLILQETSRTLTDEDADAAMTAAVRKLKDQFAAELRG